MQKKTASNSHFINNFSCQCHPSIKCVINRFFLRNNSVIGKNTFTKSLVQKKK